MAKITSILVVLCVILPVIICQCNRDTAKPLFSRAVYDFSLDLTSRISQETDNHFIASGLSPWTLLAAVSLGAADETLAEIQRTLRLHKHRCFQRKYYELAATIGSASEEVTLEKSSALFIDDKLPINDAFRNGVQKTGVSDVSYLSFDNYVSAATTINEYVKSATHGMIEEVVSSNDLEGINLILIDALYFKASWKIPFSPESTREEDFFNNRGNKIGTVNMMSINEVFRSTSIDLIKAGVVELPYGNDDNFSMLLFLPYSGTPAAKVMDSLSAITVSSIFKLFESSSKESIVVNLPRFKITSDLDLKELLTDMGLKTMFDNQANFPYISDYALYISNFIQKAAIEVTEEGTTASAATQIGFESRSYPIEYTFNRPFLFMIVDRELEIPVFTGFYSKPSLY